MKHLAALFILFFASGIEVFSMEKDTLASEDLKYSLLFEDEDPSAAIQYFKYDSITNDLKPLPIGFRPEKFTDAFSFDPVRFTLSSNKETVTLGEEIEITITAEFLDVNPNLMFTFEGSNAYTLKMLMPKGFVHTGGDYYEYIKGQVDRNEPVKTYKVKGYFEYDSEECFRLLRGTVSKGSSLYVLKSTYCHPINDLEQTSSFSNLRGVNSSCSNTDLSFEITNLGNFIEGSTNVSIRITFQEKNFWGNVDGYPNNIESVRLSFGTVSDYATGVSCSSQIVTFQTSSGSDNYVDLDLVLPKPLTFKGGLSVHVLSYSANFQDGEPNNISCSPPSGTNGLTFSNRTPDCPNGNCYSATLVSGKSSTCSPEETTFIQLSNPPAGINDVIYTDLNGGEIGRSSNRGDGFRINNVLGGQTVVAESNSCINSGQITIGQDFTPNIRLKNCSGQTVTLEAVGCAGLVYWSNGATGENIQVGLGTYSARCSPNSLCISDVYEVSETSPLTPNVKIYGDACGNVTPRVEVTNCGGSVNWSNGQNGSSVFLGAGNYSVTCSNSCGTSPIKSFSISDCGPSITASSNSLCIGETAFLKTTGCATSAQVTYEKFNGTAYENLGSSNLVNIDFPIYNITAGKYRSYCGSTKPLDGFSYVEIASKDNPIAPVISSSSVEVCGTDRLEILIDNSCSSGVVEWSNGETDKNSITVNKSGVYSAHCKTICDGTSIESPESNAITITYSEVCSCETASISSNVSVISEGEELIVKVTEIANATYVWEVPKIENADFNSGNNELTINSVSAEDQGIYKVTLDCRLGALSLDIPVNETPPPKCVFETSAWSNSPNGQVGVDGTIQLTANGGDSYQWWKHGSNGTFSSAERAPRISDVQVYDGGIYQVEISKTINGTVCKKVENVSVSISGCNLDAHAYFYESGNTFQLQAGGNFDHSQASVQWWKGNVFYGETWNIFLDKNDLNRGTYYAKIIKGTCNIDIPVEVDYVATPVYTGSSVHAVACQRIQAGILDQANAYKSISFTAQVKIDDDVYNVPLRQNGDGTPAILYFNVPEKYKDGLEHDVTVRDPYGTPITNWAEESFMCCTLEFDNEPTVTCEDPVKSNYIEVAVTNMSAQGDGNMYFKVDQLAYDEDGELLTSIGNTWVSALGISAEFTDLDKGNYLISAREGTAGCEVSTIVPVYCGDENEDCTVPIISVFPGTDIKEGEGVYPVLYADVAHINASDNKEGLVLDGNSSISISTNTQLWGEFSVEALVNPEQGKTISLGDHSESSTQRYLFKSSYGGGGDFVAPQLSVGSNGINLIETGLNHSRLVLSYPTKLVGWNHIAVTYEDNKARLLINGVMVKSSDTKPPFNRSVVGPDHIGTDLNRGFVGSVYSFRIWREAMSDQQIAQLKNNFSPSLAVDPSTGFWLFDKSPVDGIIEDLSVNGRDGKVEGLAYVLEPSEPINSPTAPVVSWWLDGTQVGTGPVYNVPPNKVQAGDLDYTAKYQNIDGSYCEADVTITVNPINFGSLSGCYLVKPVAHDHSMAPFQDATNNFRINVANYSEFPEKKIWKFAHLGNEDYRITSTFYDKSLDNDAGELTLSDTRTSALSQKWNAVPIDGNNLIYKFESLSSSANYLKFGYFDTDYFTISGGSEASKSFKLIPTACPLPPAECDVNGQITFERFMQESLINYWYSEFQALDVPTFITENEDYPPIYVHTGDIGDISISRNIYSQMHAITPRILPAAWANHSTQDEDLWVGRMSGYFCPPENGDFTFYIKSDEWSEIWISTDEDPSHKVRVAYNHIYSADWTTNHTQKSDFITLTKGRMYYVEVIFKDQANTFFVDVAYQKGGGPIQNLTTEHFSSKPRDIPPGIFSVSANKTSAAPTESVTLTANGCYYGRVVWRVGATVIQDENASIPTITEIGPGTYQAICTGDPSVIQEWVTIYIEPTTAIVPIPSGPNYACDGQTITLTASGAPTGYTYKWYVLKDEAAKKFFRENIAVFDLFVTNPELFNTYTTTTASVTGPGDYYLQTISGNGAYKSEIRKITIAPAFPDDLEASNNSPIEIDGVLTLAVGYAPAGTTYSWTGPSSESPSFTATGRNVARTNFTEAMAGVYTVTIATGSTCSFTSTTEVSVANCDIYIQSKDASDQETYTLERTPGVAGSFEPLTLSILPYTGTNTFDAYKVVWYYNGDPIEPAPTTKTIEVSKAGDYRAVLSLKLNPSTICETEVHIAGKPCSPPTTSGVCGPVTIPVPDNLSEGVQLAPGDEFTAGDYTVIVTEITSGSKAGWWGKGYVAMRLINDINAAKISVTFEDAVINECYELAAGRVLTEYDPNWGGILDVDETICAIKNIASEISIFFLTLSDEMTLLTCSEQEIQDFRDRIESVEYLKGKVNSSCDITAEERDDLIARIDALKSTCICLLDSKCPVPEARSQARSISCSYEDLSQMNNALMDALKNTSATSLIPFEASSTPDHVCNSNGSQTPIDLGSNVYQGYNSSTKVWLINNIEYLGFSRGDSYEFLGLFKKTDVDALAEISVSLLESLPTLSGFQAGTPTISSTCPNGLLFDPNSEGQWLTEKGRREMKKKLDGMGDYAKNVEVILKDCSDPESTHSITKESIAEGERNNKSIQIVNCWDGAKWIRTIVKYDVNLSGNSGFRNKEDAKSYAEGLAKNALDNDESSGGYSHPTEVSEDGFHHKFEIGKLDGFESAIYFLETGKYVIENLQVPPPSWNGDGSGNKVINISPIIGGGADQGLQELKDVKELVVLGCQFVKAPSATATAIWDGVKNIGWEEAASMALGDWSERYENYKRGEPHTWYQGGRDGVLIVKYFSTAGIFTITGGIKEMPAELRKKFDDVSDLFDGIVSRADNLVSGKVANIKAKYPNAQVGYRGSLANGAKYNKDFKLRGGDEYLPFAPDDWDVDAFIVDDVLAAKFNGQGGFKNVRDVDSDIANVCNDLDNSFRLENGYRIEAGKPFTFAVWTTEEFNNKIKELGFKIL